MFSKLDDDDLLRLESDTEARSSFEPQENKVTLPENYHERLKVLDLEMTADTRLNKSSSFNSSGNWV